jgi:hypothetical protein
MKDNVLGGLLNVARTVKFSDQYLSCNGLNAYCMSKHRVLETLQWQECGKCEEISSTISLILSALSVM